MRRRRKTAPEAPREANSNKVAAAHPQGCAACGVEGARRRRGGSVARKTMGLRPERWKDNPEEKAFAVAWAREEPNLLRYLLGDGMTPVVPSDRDRVVAATVVQWFGSPVGQGFLRDLGWGKRAKVPA